MYKIFYSIIVLWWALDIFNINIPEISFILNDANKLNTLFWIVVWISIPSTGTIITQNNSNSTVTLKRRSSK